MTLRALSYGNYGIFLIIENAGFISSTIPVADKTYLLGFRLWFLLIVPAEAKTLNPQAPKPQVLNTEVRTPYETVNG